MREFELFKEMEDAAESSSKGDFVKFGVMEDVTTITRGPVE